jgi:hypothetical protein
VSFLKPIVAGLVALSFGWFTIQLLHINTHLILAGIDAIVILVSYGSTILLLGLSPEDLAVINQLRRRIALISSRK